MVISSRAEYNGLVLGDALDLVSPFSSNLHCRLGRLGTGTRGENSIVAKKPGHELSKLRIHIVVERAGGERQSARLLDEGSDELWVTVAMVESRRGRVEVEILTTFRIPDIGPLGAGKYDGERLIVLGGEVLFSCERSVGAHGARRGWKVAIGVVTVAFLGHDAWLQ
jgi:hypothetical protein